jgi:hypothetical protein
MDHVRTSDLSHASTVLRPYANHTGDLGRPQAYSPAVHCTGVAASVRARTTRPPWSTPITAKPPLARSARVLALFSRSAALDRSAVENKSLRSPPPSDQILRARPQQGRGRRAVQPRIRHGFHDGAAGRSTYSTMNRRERKGNRHPARRPCTRLCILFSVTRTRTGARPWLPYRWSATAGKQTAASIECKGGSPYATAAPGKAREERTFLAFPPHHFSGKKYFPHFYLPVLLFRNAGSRSRPSLAAAVSFVPEWGASVQPLMINGYVANKNALHIVW